MTWNISRSSKHFLWAEKWEILVWDEDYLGNNKYPSCWSSQNLHVGDIISLPEEEIPRTNAETFAFFYLSCLTPQLEKPRLK